MTTFSLTLEEYKHMVASFTKAAPTADFDSLEAGFKAVSLGLIGIKEKTEVSELIAQSYFYYSLKAFNSRLMELDAAA